MLLPRTQTLTAVLGLALMAAAARVEAAPIFDPNGKPENATVLTSGQLIVDDSLSANQGRPDTLLGSYNPSYQILLDTDDDSSTLGNGFASALVGVPLRPNGSAYFRVTGAADVNFTGAHTQSGRYSVRFDIYDSSGVLFKTMPLEFESVSPGMIDNVWLDPPAVAEPERVGGTVDVTVNNIVGPGTGDSVDFFWFSGLLPGQEFLATLTAADFDPLLGWFGGPGNALLEASEPGAAAPMITGVADQNGRALLAVTGVPDVQFKGEHVEVGQYTLVVIPEAVPEPSSVALLGLGGALVGLYWRRRRRGR